MNTKHDTKSLYLTAFSLVCFLCVAYFRSIKRASMLVCLLVLYTSPIVRSNLVEQTLNLFSAIHSEKLSKSLGKKDYPIGKIQKIRKIGLTNY